MSFLDCVIITTAGSETDDGIHKGATIYDI
jgi:hypothetical protein